MRSRRAVSACRQRAGSLASMLPQGKGDWVLRDGSLQDCDAQTDRWNSLPHSLVQVRLGLGEIVRSGRAFLCPHIHMNLYYLFCIYIYIYIYTHVHIISMIHVGRGHHAGRDLRRLPAWDARGSRKRQPAIMCMYIYIYICIYRIYIYTVGGIYFATPNP